MDNEVYSFALKNTLNEIQKICPDVKNAFVFKEDGEIVAGDENTAEETIVHTIDALDGMLEKGEATGGVENIIFEGNKGRLNVSHINDLYLVTVTSKGADVNYVNTVTHVLVSTVLKLLEKINPAPLENNSGRLQAEPEDSITENSEEPAEEFVEEVETLEHEENVEPEAETESRSESIVPEAPVNQFIVENIGGLLVSGDTVRIDNDILLQWKELYEDRKIEEAEIETFGGKSTRCKLKPVKDSKYEGKGIIQMPEKIQHALGIRKGELVRVKPVIE
jgi:predicted regulator of Ras-like GTPase activity (Roadblock/LC7/MglB family)